MNDSPHSSRSPFSPLTPYSDEMRIGPWMRENHVNDDDQRVAANAADAAADAAYAADAAEAAAEAAVRAAEAAREAAAAAQIAAARARSAAARQKNLHASRAPRKTPGGGGSKRKKTRKCSHRQ